VVSKDVGSGTSKGGSREWEVGDIFNHSFVNS